MFNFFRINDPYRVVVIFIILLLLNLPFFIGGYPFSLPQLHHMVIGEKLASGITMYKDLWDDIGPLSAGVYWLIESVFNRAPIVYNIIALILIIIQGTILNYSMLKHKLYNENSYTFALIYVLLFAAYFDFCLLSPVLMGNTFLILAINKLITHIQTWQKSDDRILTIGVFLGIATLFFAPLFIFSLLVFFSFIFFTGTSVRRNLLFVYGFIMPLIIAWLYYVWQNSGYEFIYQAIYSVFIYRSIYYTDLISILIVAITPTLFTIYSALKIFSSKGYTNFQVRIQQLMVFMLALGVIAFSLANYKAPHMLILFFVPAAFFLNHLFLRIKRKFWQELTFAVFIILIIWVNFGSLSGWHITDKFIDEEDMLVKETRYRKITENKNILVLDQNLSVYQNSKLATPYFSYKLSLNHFASPGYYDNLTAILQNFEEDTPEVIIDPNKHMPAVFESIPVLARKYRLHQQMDNVYILQPD
ncbi:MAG: hypothetical protein ACOCWM_01395 [Cyclobacteriaceae bacterium]